MEPTIRKLIDKFERKVAADEGVRDKVKDIVKTVSIDLGEEHYSFRLQDAAVHDFKPEADPAADMTVICTPENFQALVDGTYERQSDLEREITERVNESHVGALGLGGDTTVLATFMKVGPQRASGVRIVCMRPCCCFEPRIANCTL